MGQALYRKYRSKKFDEVIGQSHVTETLKEAIKTGKISHAYLFTGPRGVGKTSVARILAHELNDLPYTDETMHLDIIEIDAASNRRIDEIRDLREKVHTAPTSAKYKVYIIDEVHMLTREAFNALLKTLEEPPAHCIFILATTEAHKLPETITSRTQRFNFKAVGDDETTTHLKSISRKEKIDITPAALQLLAEHGEGSFRDSIGLLDQLASTGSTVDEDSVRELLGIPPADAIEKLVEALDGNQPAAVLGILEQLRNQGSSPVKITFHLSRKLRQAVIDSKARPWTIDLLRDLLNVPSSPNPQDYLEICLIGIPAAPNEKAVEVPISREPDIPKPDSHKNIAVDEKPGSAAKLEKITSNSEIKSSFDLDSWPRIIEKVKLEAASLYTALRLADPGWDGQILTLTFQFPLHQKKVLQVKNIQLIGRIVEEETGSSIRIRCLVDKNAVSLDKKTVPLADDTEQTEKTDPLTTINNIFGAAEVLES